MIARKKIYITIFFITSCLLFGSRFHGTFHIFDPDICELPMIWKHSAGTIQEIQLAKSEKYCGAEIDVNLHPDGVFISEYYNHLNLDAPKLVDLIKSAPSIQYWWLDFKNLEYDNAAMASSALMDLAGMTDGRIIVESHNFLGLLFLNTEDSEILKAYWLAKNPKPYLYFLYLARSILAMAVINPDLVTLFANQAGSNDYIWVGSRQRMAFTVNDENILNELYLKDIEVILTDTLKP